MSGVGRVHSSGAAGSVDTGFIEEEREEDFSDSEEEPTYQQAAAGEKLSDGKSFQSFLSKQMLKIDTEGHRGNR